MPPLEALACGVPVICADNSSLPEVVGDTGKLINSDDRDGLLSAISDYIKHSADLNKKLLTAGPERASQFSWTESAKIFLEVAKDLDS